MPDWEARLVFFLRSLVKQKDALTKKIALEDTQTIDFLPLRLKELVVNGYLVPKGQGRGARYITNR